VADFFYYNWVDLKLGNNVPIINGTGSDFLIAFLPDKKEWVVMRLPYPLGFFTRGMDAGQLTRVARAYKLASRRKAGFLYENVCDVCNVYC
jgi:hypothetical protein